MLYCGCDARSFGFRTYCRIEHNTGYYGGGVYAEDDAVFETHGGAISENRATADGGGIYLWSATAKLDKCIVSANKAKNGGAIYSDYSVVKNYSSLTVDNTKILNNTADNYYGGIYHCAGDFSLLGNTRITGNKNEGYYGGGVYSQKVPTVPEGKVFSHWEMEGDNADDITGFEKYAKSPAKLEMPQHDVTFKAVFKEKVSRVDITLPQPRGGDALSNTNATALYTVNGVETTENVDITWRKHIIDKKQDTFDFNTLYDASFSFSDSPAGKFGLADKNEFIIYVNMKSSAYVLIFDINKFKQLNDTYGHAEGDRALKLVARQIYKVYGKYGACYRIGGDEFCVIMLKNLDKIKILNCRFQEAMAHMNQNNIKLSGVSLGYAYYDEKKMNIKDVIAQADEMMYNNKCGNMPN